MEHLCAPGNVFEARSTFPTAYTAEEYAESHSHVMRALNDLHIISFQLVNVKGSLQLAPFLSTCRYPPFPPSSS